MKVFPVIQKTQTNTYSQNNQNSKQTFSAKQFPNDPFKFSDWFVELLTPVAKLDFYGVLRHREEHLNNFRQKLIDNSTLSERLFKRHEVRKKVSIRQIDYDSLIKDLQSLSDNSKIVNLGKLDFDEPIGEYSTHGDYYMRYEYPLSVEREKASRFSSEEPKDDGQWTHLTDPWVR